MSSVQVPRSGFAVQYEDRLQRRYAERRRRWRAAVQAWLDAGRPDGFLLEETTEGAV